MFYLLGDEEKEAIRFINKAKELALFSSCRRSRCGTVIVKDNVIVGQGYNSMPAGKITNKCFKDDLPENFISDRTCCVHAEQRAIMDALKTNPDKIIGSRLYFIRIDGNGNILKAGKPYCTICSKLALDSGIAEFVLWHNEGVCVYGTDEYNDLSFKFQNP